MREVRGTLLRLARPFMGIALLAWAVQEVQAHGQVGDMGLLADWMPAQAALAWVAAAIFLVAGVAVLAGVGLRATAAVMGAVFAVDAVLRFAALVPQMWSQWGYRGVPAELFACGAGMWMLSPHFAGPWPSEGAVRRMSAAGLAVFGVTCVVFGSIHWQVGPTIAALIPKWLPAHLALAYLTGAALVGAGVAFLLRRWVEAAGLWLALMFFLWVVMLHGPRIAHALRSIDEWNSGFVCLSMAAVALAAAQSAESGPEAEARRRQDAEVEAEASRV